MRKEFEHSIEQAHLETELVGREGREELRNGLRIVHEHLKSADEMSQQERVASAEALKKLKRELQRDLEDQVPTSTNANNRWKTL